eukprot:5672277-Amphidinium_carterae.1
MGVERSGRYADRVPTTRRARKRLPSESSYSELDDAEAETQEWRSQLAKERRRPSKKRPPRSYESGGVTLVAV